jgi:tetratricopeptide (TPR) repeat protein
LVIVASVVLIALSAAFLGGEASELGEAMPVIGVGLLLLILPFKALPNRVKLTGLVGLLLCGFLGFLPARWFGQPEWHMAIRHVIPGLGDTVSLQPFHSLLCIGLMATAVLFTVWLVQWKPVDFTNCMQALTGGIALLASIALAARIWAFSVPSWHPSQGFGPFENRNQTGTLMALGAMLALGLCAQALRRRHAATIIWFLSFAVCLGALIFSNSRTPFSLLVLGSFFWICSRQKTPLKGFAIASGVASLVCAAALIVGEGVARRLPDLFNHDFDFRTKIYEDSLRLAGTAPVVGIGIGNFEAVFPQFRVASLNGQRVIHPESDWLWMASEMGCFSILFCIIAVVGLLTQRGHPATRGDKDLQSAGLIAIAAFLANSLVDVPGHRLGTVLPVLVLAGTLGRPKLILNDARGVSWLSRISGIGLIAFGVLLLREPRVKTQIESPMAAGDWIRTEETVSKSLVSTPLSWSLWLIRGYAEVHQNRWLQAIADFRHALFLEPKLAVVPFGEGSAWINVNSSLALGAWKEALRRSRVEEIPNFYRQMLDASSGDPQLHIGVLRLADGDPLLAMTALRSGYADSKTLQFLETQKSKLSADENQVILRAEAWQAAGEKDFQKAYELGRRGMRQVFVPARSQQSEQQCRDALIRDPQDFAAAYNLCSILRTKERWQEPLQILETISRAQNCPDYFQVMRAEILASQNRWAEAWDAIAGLVK